VEFFDDDEDTQHDSNFDPDMLTDKGWYTMFGVAIRHTFIVKTRAADCKILQLITRIDRYTWNFGDYYYIYLSIIKGKRSDQEESK